MPSGYEYIKKELVKIVDNIANELLNLKKLAIQSM